MQYEWKWKRQAKKKAFLILYKNAKKIGSVSLKEFWCFDLKIENYWMDVYIAYNGGKNLGEFDNMTSAKIAVEQSLGISTKKPKKKPEPKLIK